jgi:hypothetical protein
MTQLMYLTDYPAQVFDQVHAAISNERIKGADPTDFLLPVIKPDKFIIILLLKHKE